MKLTKISCGLLLLSSTMISSCEEANKEVENKKPTTAPPAEVPKEKPKPNVHYTDEYKEDKVDLGLSVDDKSNLLFLEKYPIGTGYKKMHDELNLKGMKPKNDSDELASQGLTESDTKVKLFGKSADLKLQFNQDSLSGFAYTISENDYNKADRYYKGLKQFYTAKFGACKEPVAEEETRTIKTCNWDSKTPYGSISHDINTGEVRWGISEYKIKTLFMILSK